MACGEAGREGGLGGDDDDGDGDGGGVADCLGVVDVSQNSTHCHIRLKHGIISLNITGCGEIIMPQFTLAHLQQVPFHPSRLLLLGRLSQCPLRLGDGAERAAVVVAFEYRNDLETLVERMKQDSNERRVERVHSTLSAPSSSVQRQRAHQSLSSPLASQSFSTRSPGSPSTASLPSLPKKKPAACLSVSKLPEIHQPKPPPPPPPPLPSSSSPSQNPPPIPQRIPTASAGVQRSKSCLPQHPPSTVPYSNTSHGALDRSSSTTPALPPRAPVKNKPPLPPPVDLSRRVLNTNDALQFRPQPTPPVGHRVSSPPSLASTTSFMSSHVSGSSIQSSHAPSQFQPQTTTTTLERRESGGDHYLDMSGNASPRGTPEQNYVSFDPVSDSSARQCEEAIRELIEREEEYISKLDGIGRSLAGSSSNFLLLEITKQAYDFHSLVLRRGMKRVHTARHLAESFVNCSEVFKIYRDLLLEYSKSLHRPSKASNLEDFLLILTKLQYYEDVLAFLSKYEMGPYLLLRQALNVVKVPLVAVNSHLIFDRVDVCPISRHHHGPAVRTGWIQLTGRTPPGVARVFAILTRTHLIFTQKSAEKERLTYTSAVRLKGASLWVEQKCLTIEDTRRDKEQQQQKLVYSMSIDADVELAAWVTSISGAIHKNTDVTKPYSEC